MWGTYVQRLILTDFVEYVIVAIIVQRLFIKTRKDGTEYEKIK